MKHYKIKLKSSVKISLDGMNTKAFQAGDHTVDEDELKVIKSAFKASIDGKPIEIAAPEAGAASAPDLDIHQRVAALEETVEQLGAVIEAMGKPDSKESDKPEDKNKDK